MKNKNLLKPNVDTMYVQNALKNYLNINNRMIALVVQNVEDQIGLFQ